MVIRIISLILAHHIADVSMQPTWLIENKAKHIWSVYEHSMVYTAVISLVLFVWGDFSWWKFVFILIGHFSIDYTKYIVIKNKYWWLIYPDQILHYLQLIIIA